MIILKGQELIHLFISRWESVLLQKKRNMIYFVNVRSGVYNLICSIS